MISRIIVLCMLILVSCAKPEQKTPNRYLDLRKLFETEASRLAKLDPKVNKTVSRNQVSETKKDISIDWKNELSLFMESDINKPAWRDSYRIDESKTDLLYTALDSNLRTRSIHIKKNLNGKLMHVFIVNKTHNNLYQSSEELSYIPDSMYHIVKQQHVILLGDNRYEITGAQNSK
jgi:hypothetical protein